MTDGIDLAVKGIAIATGKGIAIGTGTGIDIEGVMVKKSVIVTVIGLGIVKVTAVLVVAPSEIVREIENDGTSVETIESGFPIEDEVAAVTDDGLLSAGNRCLYFLFVFLNVSI